MMDADWTNIGIFVLTAVGFAFTGWKYMQSRFDKERDERAAAIAKECLERSIQVNAAAAEARAASDKLDAFVLEAIKTFATKQGVSEAFDRVTKAVESVGANVDRKFEAMTERLDRVIENRRQPPPNRS